MRLENFLSGFSYVLVQWLLNFYCQNNFHIPSPSTSQQIGLAVTEQVMHLFPYTVLHDSANHLGDN